MVRRVDVEALTCGRPDRQKVSRRIMRRPCSITLTLHLLIAATLALSARPVPGALQVAGQDLTDRHPLCAHAVFPASARQHNQPSSLQPTKIL